MRLVGIEVGERELRVARAERRLGTTRLVELLRVPYGDPHERRAALARIAAAAAGATVVTALPLAATTHRLFALPFRDRRRIAETAPLELLGQLPAGDADELVTAVEPTAVTRDGATVLGLAARRSDLATLRALLAEAGLVPARIAVAPLPAWHLVPADDAALVVADGLHSSVTVRRGGRVVGLRALAARPSDAEAFGREVRWTLAALGGAPEIVVAGGDADATLVGALAAATGVAAAGIADVAPPAWRQDGLGACALAAGLVAGPSLALEETAVEARPRRLAALAAAVVVLAVADLAVVRSGLARREALLAQAVRTTAASALPPGTRIVAPQAQLEAALGGAGGDPGPRGTAVLALLRELSARTPATVRLDLDELVVTGDVVRLHGRADGYGDVDTVRRALAAAPGLAEVTADESRATVDGHGVEFAIRARWRPVAGAPS